MVKNRIEPKLSQKSQIHMEQKEGDGSDRYRLVIPKPAEERLFTEELSKDLHLKGNRKNIIKTTKYTIWSFIPKNLFEQFHRFANLYFLMIVVLNWVPEINAFGKEIAMFPLVFVLSVTAFKDIFEDRRRYISDRDINNRICQVYDSTQKNYISRAWKEVVVGDLIHLKCDESIPSDLLLLNTSEPNHVCHVETANLDGETNLKQREVVKELFKDGNRFSPEEFVYKLKCELPNNHIYKFHGTLFNDTGKQIPVDRNNILLRGCVIRNTRWVEGMVVYAGHDTKAMLNNSGPRYKRSKLERDINLDVIACVVILFTLCFLGGVGCASWTRSNDYFNRHFASNVDSDTGKPFSYSPLIEGVIRFWTFIIIFQVLIPISLYVSVEIVKLGQIYFISNDLELYNSETDQPILCRALNINEDLGQIKYIFSDKTGTLTENKMVFKRCTIGGRNFPHLETTDTDVTDSGGATENSQMYHQLSEPQSKSQPAISRDPGLVASLTTGSIVDEHSGPLTSYLREFFILMAICNTVVVSRNQHAQENGDSRCREERECDESSNAMNYIDSDGRPNISSSSLVGNTTQTDQLSADGEVQSWNNSDLSPSPVKHSSPAKNGEKISLQKTANSADVSDKECIYEAESPDEAALVKAACCYGYRLVSRSPDSVTVYVPGEGELMFEILHILTFDSSRKRMSVVVRHPTSDNILLYCKGADSAILSHLAADSYAATGADCTDAPDSSRTLVDRTETHLNGYAKDGLRTLCMARKELSLDEYYDWLESHRTAETALRHREKLLHESACRLERNLELLGATGIEDRLQDGVPETIAKLREAGIKVWVLTGDKQETAVNIGYACHLLDNNMEKVIIIAKTKTECSSQILGWLDYIAAAPDQSEARTRSMDTVSGQLGPTSDKPLGLIINGPTLAFALEKPLNLQFLNLAKKCQVVLCCRATPIQKSAVVQLVRDNLKEMTLAIGDGANDVSMIQMADVGVGISGQEGMQAVMSSDFAIARFKFLAPLLLVHGHWCYDRLAKMFLYFFYKNAMFVFVLFWYQLYNGFSGSNAIDDLALIFFNLLFTAVPPIVSGILDQNVPRRVLNDNPALYKTGQNSELYSRKWFWISILDALYQSVVIFYAAFWVYSDSRSSNRMVGVTLHQSAVIVASLHMGIAFSQWTVVHHMVLWGSVLLSFLWFVCYSPVSPTLDMYFVAFETMATKEFWLLCLLTAVTALLPRYIFKILHQTFWPSETDKALQETCEESARPSGTLFVDGDHSVYSINNSTAAS